MHRPASERVVIQSPTSYVGATRRLWGYTQIGPPPLRWVVLVPLALMAILGAWLLVTAWYVLFGLFLVPWRLLRRGQRKRKQEERRHQEVLRRMG